MNHQFNALASWASTQKTAYLICWAFARMHTQTHTSVAFSELLKNDAPFKQFLLAVLTLNSQADRCIQFSWKRCISMQTLANERDIHTFKYTTIFFNEIHRLFSSIFLSIFYSKSMCLFYLIFCYNFFFSFVRFVYFIRRRKKEKRFKHVNLSLYFADCWHCVRSQCIQFQCVHLMLCDRFIFMQLWHL